MADAAQIPSKEGLPGRLQKMGGALPLGEVEWAEIVGDRKLGGVRTGCLPTVNGK